MLESMSFRRKPDTRTWDAYFGIHLIANVSVSDGSTTIGNIEWRVNGAIALKIYELLTVGARLLAALPNKPIELDVAYADVQTRHDIFDLVVTCDDAGLLMYLKGLRNGLKARCFPKE